MSPDEAPVAGSAVPKKHPEFAVHRLNQEGMEKATSIAFGFDLLLGGLEAVCMPGRELSICKTKLEEACFFAKKAMAINLGNQASLSLPTVAVPVETCVAHSDPTPTP